MTTILIAEDNADNLDMLSRRLKRSGYTILKAIDGQEAVQIATSHNPDIILMDLSMPILSGLEATHAIRSATSCISSIPIIALTAHAMESDRKRCLQAGCNAFATKPVEYAKLLKLINSFEVPA